MVSFLDEHWERWEDCGIEPVCAVLPIAPSACHRHKHLETQPEARSRRARRDEGLREETREIWKANQAVHGRKVRRSLRKQRPGVARCTLERLMPKMGLHGVDRDRKPRTTTRARVVERPLDQVNR